MSDPTPVRLTLPPHATSSADAAAHLTPIVEQVHSHLHSRFSSRYEVAAPPEGSSDEADEWERSITVQQGAKVGARVKISWEKSAPTTARVEIEQHARLEGMLMLFTIGPIVAGCMLSALMEVGPLAALPGRRLAALIAGLIGVVLGGIVYAIVRALVLGGSKAQNEALTAEVSAAVAELRLL